MGNSDLKAPCAQCNGVGTVEVWVDNEQTGTETCPMCGGDTEMVTGSIDFGTKVIRSDQFINATVTSEYHSLTGTERKRYDLIVSAGFVDMNDGTVRTDILDMFDTESTTRSNILALIGE